MYDYNMCLRRYSQVSERVEELEESHSKCDGAEHRVKVMFQTFGVSVRFRDQSLFMGGGGVCWHQREMFFLVKILLN